MNHLYDKQEREGILKARESYSGRLLTDSQFDEAIAITGIMEREIRKSGTFKQKLGDYAYTFSRNEKFDMVRTADTLRDLFKARTGQTMNQMREGFLEQEKKLIHKSEHQKLSKADKSRVVSASKALGQMIKEGDKIPFHRAYAHHAAGLAKELEITDSGAKTLMKAQFKETENRELYDWGKALEAKYYQPQIETEKVLRGATQAKQPASEMKPIYSRKR